MITKHFSLTTRQLLVMLLVIFLSMFYAFLNNQTFNYMISNYHWLKGKKLPVYTVYIKYVLSIVIKNIAKYLVSEHMHFTKAITEWQISA